MAVQFIHRVKLFAPFAIALAIHCYALATNEFGGTSLIYRTLTLISWNGPVSLLQISELLQRLICVYFSFVVWEVLKDENGLHRIIAAVVLPYIYALICVIPAAYIALPSVPVVVRYVAIVAGIALLLLLALTYNREVTNTELAV